MKRVLVSATLALAVGGGAWADFGVVPTEFENADAPSSFLYMVTTGRTYQMLINESELTGFVGKKITGITWRNNGGGTANWPAVDASFNSFDVYMGEGVAPAARSTSFAANYAGARTQVRSGSLTFAAGSFGFGSPAPWGVEIGVNDYIYTGGHLTIEFRHTGMTGNTTSQSFDATATSTSGYGTRFSALWTGSYDGVTGGQGNFFISRLTVEEVPAPGALALLGLSGLVSRRRRQA